MPIAFRTSGVGSPFTSLICSPLGRSRATLPSPRDGERCVTSTRAAAKETTCSQANVVYAKTYNLRVAVRFQRRTSAWSPGTESWAQGESVWGANSLYTVFVEQLQLHRKGTTTVRLENIWVWSIYVLYMAYFCSLRLGKLRVLFGCVDDWKYLRWKKITNWSWEFNFCVHEVAIKRYWMSL